MDYPRTVAELKAFLEQRIDEREARDEDDLDIHKSSELRAQRQRLAEAEEEDNYGDAYDRLKEDELFEQRMRRW